MVQNSFFPVFVSIIDVPLIARFDNADISWTRYDVAVGFVVNQSFSFIYHLFFDHILCISHFWACKIADQHHSFEKSFLIGFVFGLSQQFFIVLTFDFHLLTEGDSSQIAMRSLDQRNRFRSHHFFSNSEFLSQSFFVSQILSGHPIVRWVTGNTSYNTCSFFHGDGHHRQGIDSLVDGMRSLQRQTHQVSSHNFVNDA